MDAGLDNVFGDFIKTHGVVQCRRGELGGVNDATFEGQVDFSAGQWADRGAHIVHDIHEPARSPYFHALEVFQFGGSLVGEEAHFLAAVAAGKSDHVVAAIQLIHHFGAAALIKPDII